MFEKISGAPRKNGFLMLLLLESRSVIYNKQNYGLKCIVFLIRIGITGSDFGSDEMGIWTVYL
jgi:hypothetical protein